MFLSLAGCTSQNINSYQALEPKLDIRDYLNGELEAWGMVFDWAGQQNIRFHVKMVGTWQGNEGVLDEVFTYDDGTTSTRVWKVTMQDDNNFTATAADVIGVATGTQKGNAVNMRYTLRIPRGDGTIDLAMDDWMYKIDEKTVLNRTSMRKFGVQVGELMLVFRKP